MQPAAARIASLLPRGYSRAYAALALFSPGLREARTQTAAGEMTLDYRESVCASLIKHGCYPHQTAEDEVVRSFAKPGSTIFDIGANIGWYSCLIDTCMAGKGATIAVEPMPRALRLLRANAAARQTIQVIPCAVGAAPGRCSLDERPALDISTIRVNGAGDTEVLTIDQLSARFGYPSFIKIDIEGGELAAFEGARKTLEARPAILFEYLPENAYSLSDLTAPLQGYSVRRIEETHNYLATPGR